MIATRKAARQCSAGHTYFKSTDCPTCPICEAKRKPTAGFLSMLGAPARRALEREEITTLRKLSMWSERDLLALHGVGPSTIPVLRKALRAAGLKFAGD